MNALTVKVGKLGVTIKMLVFVSSTATEKNPSRLPSESAKRLIFTPTIRQRASGTMVGCKKQWSYRLPGSTKIELQKGASFQQRVAFLC